MQDNKSSITKRVGQMDLSDRVLFATLLAVSYPLCLTAAIVHRFSETIFGHDAAAGTPSIFAEAKSAAYAAVGYAFHA